MIAVLVFASTLFLAVLLSGQAQRSVLSTAVLFLLAGFVAGDRILGIVSLKPDNSVVALLAELTLFSVLFTDGMRLGLDDLASAWSLPGRALLLGMPLTLVSTALLARTLVGLSWTESFLLGAVLSPTDPVLAAAIVGREEVPKRLRQLLNVESGLNDGLALPVVVVLLGIIKAQQVNVGAVIGAAALGVALGVLVPWIALLIGRNALPTATSIYEPFDAFAIGLLVLALSWLMHANEFLAAFAAGVTIATVSPEARDEFRVFGERVTELLKLAALLVFGALISPGSFMEVDPQVVAFLVLVLLGARPVAFGIALLGSGLSWRERVVAAWFGPKGFASVVYGLYILASGAPDARRLFNLTAVVVAGSIIAHSSTDVVVARWFQGQESEQPMVPE
ncbi:MAG: cation:proton antiporter [Ardenticatenaceae bacterium]|nr:cation:proton antiporter [Ardenticatenaceae bacterium]